MLSYDEALASILRAIRPVGSEIVPLASALHRVLFGDQPAREDIPSFDNSSMDGFAVRAADVIPGKAIPVQGEIPAGFSAVTELQPGKALRIFTGSPMPPGADAVLEIELAEDRSTEIVPKESIAPGRSVRKKGEDVQKGETVLRAGERLGAPHLGVLGSLGATSLDVYRIPRVAILTSGDELLPVSAALEPGKIRNSNGLTLGGLISEMHCQPVEVGVAADEEQAVRTRLAEGLQFDALVTSGGVSVGKYDLVLAAAEELGVHIHFWKVNIKPGMPFAFGMFEHRVPVFFLPGNPVSTSVTFRQLARPGLEQLSGALPRTLVSLFAALEHAIHKTDAKRHFSRGVLRSHDGRLTVRTTRTQSSGVLSSLVEANCLVVLPEFVRSLAAGDRVEVQLL